MFLNNSHNIDGRVYKECVTLTEAGHSCIVLGLYNKKLPNEENIGGAKVVRLVRWPKLKIPIIRQFLYTYNWVKVGIKLDVDVYHAHDASTLLEAVMCSVIKKKKLVYDSHELFLNIASLERKKIVKFIWWLKESFSLKKVSCVISANLERSKILKLRYPQIKNSFVLENFPLKEIGETRNYDASRKAMRAKLNILEDDVVFVFQGALSRNRGLEDLLKALPLCDNLSKRKFLIIGDGSYKKEFEKKIKNHAYNNFIFTGKINYKELPSYLVAGDIGLIYFPPICLNYIFAAPNKLYEYMLNRLAIVSGNTPTVVNVINRLKNGLIVYEDSSEDFAKVICKMSEDKDQLQKMKEVSYRNALKYYTWEKQESKFIKMYENI